MSWDAEVCRTPGVDRVSDLRDESFELIEPTEALVEALQIFGSVVPMANSPDSIGYEPSEDFDGAAYYWLEGSDLIGEMRLPDPGSGRLSVGFNLRGINRRGTQMLLEYADRLDARVLDYQSGDWLAEDGDSFNRWQAYRQRVMNPDGDLAPEPPPQA